MAHLSAFLLNSAPTSRNRYQSAAGFVAAFIGAVDPRYLHTSRHAGEAGGAKRGGTTPSTGPISTFCCTYDKRFIYKYLRATIHALARGVAPFCTYEGVAIRPVTLVECMAGTTGLEPATSAVTVSQNPVTYRNNGQWMAPFSADRNTEEQLLCPYRALDFDRIYP